MRSRWPLWLILGVGLILLGAITAGVIALRSPASPRVAPLPAAPAPAAPTSPVVPAAPPVDVSIPSTTPAGLSWSVFAGEWEPTHPTAGPLHVAGAVASGYERSPLGALIAAQQIGTRVLIAPRGAWRNVALAQIVAGPIRDRYVRTRAAATDDPPAGGWAQPVGFRYVTWTPDQAVLQLLDRKPGAAVLQGSTVTLQWLDGDWRLLMDTATAPPFTAPTSTGFVPWGGPAA